MQYLSTATPPRPDKVIQMPSPKTAKPAAVDAEAVQKAIAFSTSAFSKANDHSQKNVAALVASATALTAGAQAVMAQTTAYSKSAATSHLAALKALTGAKSLQDVVELQTRHAKASIEQFVAETGKIAETYSTSVRGVVQPLQERVTAAVKGLEPTGA